MLKKLFGFGKTKPSEAEKKALAFAKQRGMRVDIEHEPLCVRGLVVSDFNANVQRFTNNQLIQVQDLIKMEAGQRSAIYHLLTAEMTNYLLSGQYNTSSDPERYQRETVELQGIVTDVYVYAELLSGKDIDLANYYPDMA